MDIFGRRRIAELEAQMENEKSVLHCVVAANNRLLQKMDLNGQGWTGMDGEGTLRVRRRSVAWTVADAEYWAAVLLSETWSKLRAIAEDLAIEDVLPERGPMPKDPAFAAAKACGRRATALFFEQMQTDRKDEAEPEAILTGGTERPLGSEDLREDAKAESTMPPQEDDE